VTFLLDCCHERPVSNAIAANTHNPRPYARRSRPAKGNNPGLYTAVTIPAIMNQNANVELSGIGAIMLWYKLAYPKLYPARAMTTPITVKVIMTRNKLSHHLFFKPP